MDTEKWKDTIRQIAIKTGADPSLAIQSINQMAFKSRIPIELEILQEKHKYWGYRGWQWKFFKIINR